MKINLFDGLSPLSIKGKQVVIMKKIAREIIDNLSIVYDINDIESLNFYIKGPYKTTALVIRIPLKFIEADDIIEVIRDRMSKVKIPNEDDPGLSFMNINKNFSLMSGSGVKNSEIGFWYQFTDKEIMEWNRDNICSFDMFLND